MARFLCTARQSGRRSDLEHDLHLRHDRQAEGRKAVQSRSGILWDGGRDGARGPGFRHVTAATNHGLDTLHPAEEALRKPGTVGQPLPGVTVRIYDDAGRVLPSGEIGEVYTRREGGVDFTYHGTPEKRQEIERDGFVTLGDVGYLDEDGYLFLCDRKNDMVISGGANIYPAA